MEYAQLEEIWGPPPTTQPSKSKGRRQSGGPEQDEFSKKRNADMRVPPAPPAPEYGLYPGPEYMPYRMSAPIHPFYSHNRFHGNHLGTPPMQGTPIYHRCPHCRSRRRRHTTPADTELQRMTLYLTVATLVLLLYDIGTRK